MEQLLTVMTYLFAVACPVLVLVFLLAIERFEAGLGERESTLVQR